MAKTDFRSVTEYLAAQPAAARAALARVRASIRKAVPGADEVISYQIPAYKLGGRVVIYFAGWKEHYSLYPATRPLVAAFADELAPYEVNDKGTIRFPLSRRVPGRLIERIARFRAGEILSLAPGKRAGRKASKSTRAKSTRAKSTRAKSTRAKPRTSRADRG